MMRAHARLEDVDAGLISLGGPGRKQGGDEAEQQQACAGRALTCRS
jgi:hypothetical protein